MRIIKRIYFYLMALISLEVVVWGIINLARTILNTTTIGSLAVDLAGALSSILVGLPIFLFHWLKAQNEALKDDEERGSGVRAAFFYAALFILLAPVAQNLLAMASRAFFLLFNAPGTPYIGEGQGWGDNLAAVIVNLLVAIYFYIRLQSDWKALPAHPPLGDVRRFYRYLWVLYSLALGLFGIQQTLLFVLRLPADTIDAAEDLLSNGLAFMLVGIPLWVVMWQMVQRSTVQPGERSSNLRLSVLYGLALAAAVVTISAGVSVLSTLFDALFKPLTMAAFFERSATALSVTASAGLVWAYYLHWLNLDLREISEAPRQAALRRVYGYLLAALGFGFMLSGIIQLTGVLIDQIFGTPISAYTYYSPLSAGLATLLAGLPLWLVFWLGLQKEALQSGDAGDHARRSVLRKIYLYVAIFANLAGTMAGAGMLFFLLLRSLLGDPPEEALRQGVENARLLLVFALWLAYHIATLVRDGRTASQSLIEKHSAFPVIILDDGSGVAEALRQELGRQAPHIPVAVQDLSLGIPPEGLSGARAAMLTASAATHPSEALRLWLNDFAGQQIILPTAGSGQVWVGANSGQDARLIQQAAQAARQMAEGQPVRFSGGSSPWVILLMVLGGFVLFNILSLLVNIVMGFSMM
ncbi:MAG TPA: DUF5671 domain-containing protein [Anaerolineaceae bacterium]|nr:DUF5671 domain-containing protein [Anaerolineaceae bacterium]HPN51496.1 DUF5671 domain-containing protein [Anaerolineaceae bacterium]